MWCGKIERVLMIYHFDVRKYWSTLYILSDTRGSLGGDYLSSRML